MKMFKLKFFILFVLAVLCFGSGNGEGEGTSSVAERKNRTLGQDLPDYIGTSEQKKEYMIKLLSACGGQSQQYKVNEKQISFHNCTYTCVQRNRDSTSRVHRIPEGMNLDKPKDERDMPQGRKLPLANVLK
uniref:Putative secreted protein n=2 Tax=Ixodes ricinus TaxID=34613 RepID=V5H3M9_IXORI